MLLFIFESIGTSELILIGIIALIFLGPRKLPDIARKLGKVMADFRNTTSEFKETWEREVNFETEDVALRTGELPDTQVPRINPPAAVQTEGISAPEIKAIDASAFGLEPVGGNDARSNGDTREEQTETVDHPKTEESLSDKRNWL